MEISSPELEAIWAEMNSASERAQAIVATAFLEDKLTELLQAYLREDADTTRKMFKPSGPLGGLGPKIDLGYLMGLYSKDFRNDLATMADIRNRFAHWARPTTFDTKEIRQCCEKIGFLNRVFAFAKDQSIYNQGPPFPNGWARFVFISNLDSMVGHIIEMARNPSHPRVL